MKADSVITVLIAEDHHLARLGIKTFLERYSDIKIVGEAEDGSVAIEMVQRLRPAVILMDISMPIMDGVSAAKSIKDEFRDIGIVMLTEFDDETHVLAALTAGADGYCLKNATPDRIASAIRSVHTGAVWLDKEIASKIYAAVLNSTDSNSDSRSSNQEKDAVASVNRKFGLTEKEMRILGLVVLGLSNIEMADQLKVSPETVKSHLRNIMHKLAVSDRTQAAVKAVREGLLS